MGRLADWLAATRENALELAPAPAPAPPPPPPPPRPTPLGDAPHLAALLAEGVDVLLLHGQLFLIGKETPRAQAILAEHGPAITRLVAALDAGRVSRQGLAAAMADVRGWRWPGTADAPAKWPGGREAFALGVELTRCIDCKRFDGRRCARYGRVTPSPSRAVRCLWALPRKPRLNGSRRRFPGPGALTVRGGRAARPRR